jgi:hypothetical protein
MTSTLTSPRRLDLSSSPVVSAPHRALNGSIATIGWQYQLVLRTILFEPTLNNGASVVPAKEPKELFGSEAPHLWTLHFYDLDTAPIYQAPSALVTYCRHRLLLSCKGTFYCAVIWLCLSLAIHDFYPPSHLYENFSSFHVILPHYLRPFVSLCSLSLTP